MTQEEQKKLEKYTIEISNAIIDKIDNDNLLKEFAKGNNFELFIHALSSMAPAFIIGQLSEKKFKDVLEFNHYANRLITKYHQPNKNQLEQ